MIKNYLTIALRALWRTRMHTAINVGGLALGIACCLLISLFVTDELGFDSFHAKSSQVYRAFVKEDYGPDEQFFNTVTPYVLGPTLKDNFAEVAAVARFHAVGAQVKVADDVYRSPVYFAGTSFFSIFDFPALHGDPNLALQQPNQAVLSRTVAERYFGNTDAIDKTLSIELGESFETFVVKAVIDDIPANSSIQFGILISDLNYKKLYSDETLLSWFEVTPETYVLLQPGATAAGVEGKLPAVVRSALGADFKGKYTVGLQPLRDIHLNPAYPVGIAQVSDPRYSYILSAIALVILVVASINFVTLSIGRSLKRAREVAIRKVVGAQRRQLVSQFVGEAVVVTLIAMVAGLVLARLALPAFNELSGKQLVFRGDMVLGATAVALVAIVGVLAGSYPAFVLSSFKPVAILRGSNQPVSSRQLLRKVLVGFQLAMSVFLITSTLIMQRQLRYLQNKNLGFDKEQLVMIPVHAPRVGGMVGRINAGFDKVDRLKKELARIGGIASVCGSSHGFGGGSWVNLGYTDDKGVYRTFNLNTIDYDYIPTLKIEFSAGRNFSDKYPADAHRSLIVNEAFMKDLGWSDAIGKRIPGGRFQDHEIIGVVKDFNYASLYTAVQPLVMAIDPTVPLRGAENINVDSSPVPKLVIRLHAAQHAGVISQIEKVYDKVTGGEPFEPTFADDAIDAQYRSDQNLGTMVQVATALAIVIGSLGLYALASLSMQQRVREISIRKVLGASVQSLLLLLSREYVLMLAVALAVSIPATRYFAGQWLQSFQYRISIGWTTFLWAGLLSLLVALFTIAYQAISTAHTKPAETLKE